MKETLIFCDFEMNSHTHEIIAIGATKLYIDDDNTILLSDEEFYTLICPESGTMLNPYLKRMLKISDKQLRNAPRMDHALQAFESFIGDLSNFTLFYYGDYDKYCLKRIEDLPLINRILKQSVDYEKFTKKILGDEHQSVSLKNTVKAYGREFIGVNHNALDDAMNLMYIYLYAQKFPYLSEGYFLLNNIKGDRYIPEPVNYKLYQCMQELLMTSPDFLFEEDHSLEDYLIERQRVLANDLFHYYIYQLQKNNRRLKKTQFANIAKNIRYLQRSVKNLLKVSTLDMPRAHQIGDQLFFKDSLRLLGPLYRELHSINRSIRQMRNKHLTHDEKKLELNAQLSESIISLKKCKKSIEPK